MRRVGEVWRIKGTAIVTGASSGLGLEFAKLLAADGYDLVLVARRSDRLTQLGDSLSERYNIKYRALAIDLATQGSAAEVMRQLGSTPIDILINNAGFGALGAFATLDPGTVHQMIQVNIAALTELTRLVLPGMLERRRGRILQLASTAGFVPGPFMAEYYATKAYVISFTEALAEELRGTGVTVTALCPGATRTEFQSVANVESSRLFNMPGVMDAAPVVRAGYKGMMRGRTLVIPGMMNRALPLVIRLSPRRMVARVSRLFQEKVKR
ncbi:MAG TPA: SDR family oxidoreductase [Gemmatimonadales bacterium]|nr:SDR family oxidoreductase [Gemmatimonadales bacterium]